MATAAGAAPRATTHLAKVALSRRTATLVRANRTAAGVAVAVFTTAVLAAAMLPARGHLSSAITGLILVLPVVGGVAVGGFVSGLVATASCFFVYDFVFLPPYYTLYVRQAEDWAALIVYVVVTLLVARVVSAANTARNDAQRRADEVRRLFDLSELLVRDLPLPGLLESIVRSVMSTFDLDGAALLLPGRSGLHVAASAGAELAPEELGRLAGSDGSLASLGGAEGGRVQLVALSAMGKAVGLLVLQGEKGASAQRQLVAAFANHLAIALERAKLREDSLRVNVLEEVDRLRRALVGAVSHDLRTPLATIKVSASALAENGPDMAPGDVKELAELVDAQADQLDRLVSNLLDMTRIQSGALVLRREPIAVADLLEEALVVLGRAANREQVVWRAPANLPLVDVDHLLVRQVIANLIDNALRHSPAGAPVSVSAQYAALGKVEVSVSDEGPGIPAGERTTIFEMFNRSEAGGRGGLGLAISRAFVEAHGERIWVAPSRPGDLAASSGARFVFSLPAV